jgi:S-adenosylmethionine:tRNA-ribosyltransferase-isomerase (queuine synthetase)
MTYKGDFLSNYDYEIPEELIAQKWLKMDRIQDFLSLKVLYRKFSDIVEYFSSSSSRINISHILR